MIQNRGGVNKQPASTTHSADDECRSTDKGPEWNGHRPIVLLRSRESRLLCLLITREPHASLSTVIRELHFQSCLPAGFEGAYTLQNRLLSRDETA